MAKLNQWLTDNSLTIKPQGIAIGANLSPASLSRMRYPGGAVPLTADKLDALHASAARFGYKK